MKVSIVIPALNEEKGIAQTIKSIPTDELRQLGYDTEILVIDNGSTDDTFRIALNHGARIIREPHKGYGQALRIGFANAGDIIATCDADNTYPVDRIPYLVDYLITHNIEFITTNRFFYSNVPMSLRNFIGNDLLTHFVNIIFGTKLKDSQSGMWIFRKSLLDRMKINSWDNSLSQEIKIEAIHYLKASYIEYPIYYYPRLGESQLYGSTYKALKGGTILAVALIRKKIRR